MAAEYDPNSPSYVSLFGFLGVVSAMVFTVMGAAYGTAKASIGISAAAVMRPDLMIKSIIPVIMAGIVAIYGLVVSFVLNGLVESGQNGYTLYKSFAHMASGLVVGLCGIGAGYAIGVGGDAAVRGTGQQPRVFVAMILIMIFSEVLGLYGFIVALVLTSK